MLNEVHDDEHPEILLGVNGEQPAWNALGQCIPDHHLPYTDYILVLADHQGIDLPQRCDWEAMLFLLQLQLLQRDDVTCLPIPRTEDDSRRAFRYGVQSFVAVDGAGG